MGTSVPSGEGMRDDAFDDLEWEAIAEARLTRRARRADRRAFWDRLSATFLAFCLWGCGSSNPFKGCNNSGCNNSGCNSSGCNNSGCGSNDGCNTGSDTTGSGTFVPTSGNGPKPSAPSRPAGAPSGMNEDEFEPNDTLAQSAELDEESDEMTDSAYFLTLHDGSDVDFFKLHVVDQGIDGNPEVIVALDSPGTGALPGMFIGYTCDSGQPLNGAQGATIPVSCDDSPDTCGVDETGYAFTFTPQCKSNDDSIQVIIQIAATDDQPHDYSLQLFVD